MSLFFKTTGKPSFSFVAPFKILGKIHTEILAKRNAPHIISMNIIFQQLKRSFYLILQTLLLAYVLVTCSNELIANFTTAALSSEW